LPMTAVATDFEVVTGKACGNHGLYLFCCHSL
jgi:hypothetical protein